MKSWMLGAAALALAAISSGANAAPIQWTSASGGNDHFYELITSQLSWTNALTTADALTYNGLDGYLVTITSQGENDFIRNSITAGNYWAAGTDEVTEGTWKWAAGPELGQVFWIGYSSGSTPVGQYSNWAGGEPNDAGDNEDYLVGNWNDNKWNDYPNTSLQYVVEYSSASTGGPIPEPATWAMLIGGFGGAGVMLRRRAVTA